MAALWEEIIRIFENQTLLMTEFPSEKIELASLLLLESNKISHKWLKENQDDINKSISQHLHEVGKKRSSKYCGYRSEKIDGICKAAIPLLKEQSHAYFFPFSEERYQFKQCWLNNVARLLPESQEVINVIPYLLTCYLITIFGNRFDPFDQPIDESFVGWNLVFPNDLKLPSSADRSENGGGNRSRMIKTITNHFILPFNSRYFAFLYAMYSGEMQICKPRRSPHKAKKQDDYLVLTNASAKRKCLECWEYYRQFACFCEACRDIPEVNISLSTSLFSSIWDLSCVCRSSCANQICETDEDKCSSSSSLINLLKTPLSQSDIEQDHFREKILDILKPFGNDSIQNYVDDLAYQILWGEVPKNEYQKFIDESLNSFLDQFR